MSEEKKINLTSLTDNVDVYVYYAYTS